MTGTTLCPHCGTRFKIAEAQLEAHHGMVRCGHCLQAFDTRPNFAPEEIDPQLELPILYEAEYQVELSSVEKPAATGEGTAQPAVLRPWVPDDQSAFFMPDVDGSFLSKPRSRFWTIAAFPLVLILLAQATYLFRAELAARMPELKPALIRSCKLLKCNVPLPQKVSLMSIESSDLKDDPAHKNQITLSALLRNRATYAQALPDLELTLTDSHDQTLARRMFKPEDYLPASRHVTAGLPANQELGITLHLDTADLKPVGYRLVLFYSNS